MTEREVVAVIVGMILVGGSALNLLWGIVTLNLWGIVTGVAGIGLGVYVARGVLARGRVTR